METQPRWPRWVIFQDLRRARATFGLYLTAFAMVCAGSLSGNTSELGRELIICVSFLTWSIAQWIYVERRVHRERMFRRDIEQYIAALAPSSNREMDQPEAR